MLYYIIQVFFDFYTIKEKNYGWKLGVADVISVRRAARNLRGGKRFRKYCALAGVLVAGCMDCVDDGCLFERSETEKTREGR